MKRWILGIAVFCAALGMLVNARTVPADTAGDEPIKVRVTTDKQSYEAGETVKFTFTATNTTDKAIALKFMTGQSFDITVGGSEGPKWNWAHDRMFTMALRDVPLEAGKSTTFFVNWNQKGNDGKDMPAGKYIVSGKLTTATPVNAPATSISLDEAAKE